MWPPAIVIDQIRPACHPNPQEGRKYRHRTGAACVSCTNIAPSSGTINGETSDGDAESVPERWISFSDSVWRGKQSVTRNTRRASGGWHVLTREALQQLASCPSPSVAVAGWTVNHNVLPLVLTLLNFGLCHGCFTVLCIFYSYLRWQFKLKQEYLVHYQMMMMMRDSITWGQVVHPTTQDWLP